jgi:hypothetical protein
MLTKKETKELKKFVKESMIGQSPSLTLDKKIADAYNLIHQDKPITFESVRYHRYNMNMYAWKQRAKKKVAWWIKKGLPNPRHGSPLVWNGLKKMDPLGAPLNSNSDLALIYRISVDLRMIADRLADKIELADKVIACTK